MYITKTETAAIRTELKETFPNSKFSVRGSGSTLSVTVLKSDVDFTGVFTFSPSDIRKMEWNGSTAESISQQVEYRANSETVGINKYYAFQYEETLGEKGYKFLTKVIEIMERNNYDNSDYQTDYFDVGYCSNLSIVNPKL